MRNALGKIEQKMRHHNSRVQKKESVTKNYGEQLKSAIGDLKRALGVAKDPLKQIITDAADSLGDFVDSCKIIGISHNGHYWGFTPDGSDNSGGNSDSSGDNSNGYGGFSGGDS